MFDKYRNGGEQQYNNKLVDRSESREMKNESRERCRNKDGNQRYAVVTSEGGGRADWRYKRVLKMCDTGKSNQ